MDKLFEGAVFNEDADEQPSELRNILQYSNATGKLYITADDGFIRGAEVRQQLLSGEWASNSTTDSAASCPSPSVSTMQPTPVFDLTITTFALDNSGTHAIVAGPTMTDPETSAVFLVDFAAKRPSLTQQGHSEVPTTPVDETLFSSHPGLRVLQVSWHPHSDRHVALLTSDGIFRLYDISKPDLAEQTYELQSSSGKKGFGLLGSDQNSTPVAFSFGQGPHWDKFAIYFLLENGGLSVLCPVAPFGARYPSHSIEALQDSIDGLNEEIAATAEAWLQRAFQPVSSFLSSSVEDIPDLYACIPHALDEHSPALVGPLAVETASGPRSEYSRVPKAQDLLIWRFAGVCTAVAIGSAKGPVAIHLLAGTAAPHWHPSPPQCVVQNTADLRAVRCQSSIQQQQDEAQNNHHQQQQLLLIDYVSLRPPLASGNDSDNEDASGMNTPGSKQVTLSLDQSNTDVLYCSYPGQVYAVSLPWLAVLSDYISISSDQEISKSSRSRLPDALPSARAEELGINPAGALSVAAVGDALCSSGLVVLHGDGSVKCMRPPYFGATTPSTTTTTTTTSRAKAEADIEKNVQRIYGELLKGPSNQPNAANLRVSPAKLGTPEGTKAFADALAALRSSHIEFAHRSQHDLAERLEQLKMEVQAQEERAARVEALASQAADQWEKLETGVKKATWMAENLSRRLHLLAELHWALPRPASAAEIAFKKKELPMLEDSARKLGTEVTAVGGRVAALQRGIKPMSAANVVGKSAAGLPPSQLRQVRELMAEHDRSIRTLKQQVTVLQESLKSAVAESVVV